MIENEWSIDSRDFNDLWEISLNRVEKLRYIIKDKKTGVWEIDFFKEHHDDTYFVMAEYEMPEGQESPTSIPEIIQDNLLHEVPLLDDRFSSKRLADVKHAKKLLTNILENKNASNR